MKAIVFVGHGELPLGMKQSVSMIVGQMDNIFAASLSPDDGKEQFQEKLSILDKDLEKFSSVLFFADLLGGSPCNGVIEKCFSDDRVQIITGMNLPMVITAVIGEDLSNEMIIAEGVNGISDVKKPEILPTNNLNQTPKKTAKPDSPYKIKNVRVDARGIHGQVATAWTPKLEIDRILVIDDISVKDEMQKMALKMAKPNSVKLSILSTDKAVERLENPNSYPGESLLIIIQRIETLKTLQEKDFWFKEVNMGNVPNRPGTKSYRKTIHLTDEEVEIIKGLINEGTHFTAQMVPNDAKTDFDAIINK